MRTEAERTAEMRQDEFARSRDLRSRSQTRASHLAWIAAGSSLAAVSAFLAIVAVQALDERATSAADATAASSTAPAELRPETRRTEAAAEPSTEPSKVVEKLPSTGDAAPDASDPPPVEPRRVKVTAIGDDVVSMLGASLAVSATVRPFPATVALGTAGSTSGSGAVVAKLVQPLAEQPILSVPLPNDVPVGPVAVAPDVPAIAPEAEPAPRPDATGALTPAPTVPVRAPVQRTPNPGRANVAKPRRAAPDPAGTTKPARRAAAPDPAARPVTLPSILRPSGS